MLARVSKYAFVVVWTRRFARPDAKALEKAADDRRGECLCCVYTLAERFTFSTPADSIPYLGHGKAGAATHSTADRALEIALFPSLG